MPPEAQPTPTLTRRETRVPAQRRALTPASYNAENRTVDLIAATRTRVRRWGYDGPYLEELDMTAGALDTARLDASQVPLLDTHSRWSIDSQLGLVSGHRFENDQLILQTRFGDSDKGRETETRVASGELRGVSVGYRALKMVRTGEADGLPVFLVTRWELLEVSLCPVPADPESGVRSADQLHPCIIEEESRAMPPENQPAVDPADPNPGQRTEPTPPAPQPDANAVRMDAAAALDFAADARALGVEDAQARTWATTMTPDAARSALVRAAAEKQRTDAPINPGQSTIRITQDERDTAREAIAAALYHRFDPSVELPAEARQWRGMTLLEMARANLESNGEKTRGLSRRELADLALRQHSTSDFPNILSNVSNKSLRRGYEASPATFKAWQRRATVPDFKQVTRLQLGGAPSFLLVPEGGTFKMGTIGEAKEVYALATYGRRFSITRQVIINDDVDAFTRIPEMWGRAASDFESDAAYAPLIANPNMGDGVALFHANHGNLAGSGTAVAEAGVQAGEIAMGKQTGIEGRPINLAPKYLIVARKDRVPAVKLVTSITAAKSSDVNVYQNAFDVVVESRLNRAAGATPWFMAADNSQVDTVEYAYLEGDDGVFLEERMGFEVDGMEFKARLDFAVKAIDHRGLYMDPGT